MTRMRYRIHSVTETPWGRGRGRGEGERRRRFRYRVDGTSGRTDEREVSYDEVR